MLEKTFQKNVIEELRQTYNAYVINNWGGGYSAIGIPDLTGVYQGLFFALELKTTSRASALQLKHIEMIKKAGGKAMVFYHSKKWKEELHEWLVNDE